MVIQKCMFKQTNDTPKKHSSNNFRPLVNWFRNDDACKTFEDLSHVNPSFWNFGGKYCKRTSKSHSNEKRRSQENFRLKNFIYGGFYIIRKIWIFAIKSGFLKISSFEEYVRADGTILTQSIRPSCRIIMLNPWTYKEITYLEIQFLSFLFLNVMLVCHFIYTFLGMHVNDISKE